MILAERNARHEAEALVSAAKLEIEHLKLLLAKARREQFGQTSERGKRLIDQLELQLGELEETAAEDETAAAAAQAEAGTVVAAHVRQRPARRPLPEHLPRERFVVPPPATCRCCGGGRLAKIGEVITETLDVVPRHWFVRQTVREKFTCRDCETISEPPAPFHVIPRGRIGASLLAMILFEKYGAHQPLDRQSERYAREGVDLDLSTMADHVGAAAAVLAPLHELIRGHVLAAERLHGDDTTVPVLAKGKTITGRLWAYVRDDRPFGQGQTGRRRCSSTIPATVAASIRKRTWRTMPGSYRPTPIAASPASTGRHVPAVLSPKPSVGPMPGGSSSSSPTSPAPAGRHRHRSPSRRSARSTRSLPTNARSTAALPPTGLPIAASTQLPWSASSWPG